MSRSHGHRVSLALAAALVLAAPLTAGALTPEAHGWWWRAQPGLVVPVPAPPQVPEGGLYVEGAPDGPSAVSALRLRVPEGRVAIAILLTVAQEQGGADAVLLACPAGGPWTPTQAGRWEARPQAACEGQGVLGQRAEDGSTWTFPLTLQPFTGVKDFVLVPGKDDSRPAGFDGSVFSVAFQPPGEQTLLVEDAGTDDGETVQPPVYVPPEDFGTAMPPFGASPPSALPPTPHPAPDPSAIPPRVTAPRPERPARSGASGKDARALATLIALLSVGMAGVLSRDRLVTTPRFLPLPDAGGAEQRLGGVGRFRRPRSSPPPPL